MQSISNGSGAPPPPFAFLSHRGADKERLAPFVSDAIARGVPLWIDQPEQFVGPDGATLIRREDLAGHIRQGSDWPLALDDALFQAEVIVVFWSCAWADNIDVLLREFTIAHAGARAGRVRYFPAFLDRRDALPPRLTELRANVHDTFQGYDLSWPDAPHWAVLLDDLDEALGRQQLAGDATQTPAPPSPTGATDWASLLADPDRLPKRLIEAVATLPTGPAVDSGLLPFRRKFEIAGSIGPDEAAGIVAEAAEVALATYPAALRRHRHTLVVMPAHVGNPLRVPAIEYWTGVFDTACLMGPRMLGALLLSFRPIVVERHAAEFAALLKRLESWEKDNGY